MTTGGCGQSRTPLGQRAADHASRGSRGAAPAAACGGGGARVAGASSSRKRKKENTPVTFQWKPQRSGLPQEVQMEMRNVIKKGKTAADTAVELRLARSMTRRTA